MPALRENMLRARARAWCTAHGRMDGWEDAGCSCEAEEELNLP